MKRFQGALAVLALLVSLPAGAIKVDAAVGFDSLYSGESAFLTLAPGETGTFTVFFLNSGTTTWTTGTSTAVELAVCLADKVTCNASDPLEAPFNPGTWLSATRYAAPAQVSVSPGQIATFTYSVKVPLGTIAGIYRFNGDLVVAATGERIHPEGYYQDVQTTASVASLAIAPASDTNEILTSHSVTITFTSASGVAASNVPVDIFVVNDATPFTTAGQCNRDADAVQNFTGQTACTIDLADPHTDSAGKVIFSWSGSAREKHRVIAWTAAQGTVYSSTSSLTQAAATKTWTGTISNLDVDPDTKTNTFSSTHTATAQLKESDGTAVAAAGLTVRWQVVRGASDAGTTCTGGTFIVVTSTVTDAAGKATLTYTGPPDPSSVTGDVVSDCVFAFFDRNNNSTFESGTDPSDAVPVKWSDQTAGTGNTITLSPSNDGNPDTGTHFVTATMKDVFGNPVANAIITFQVSRTQATSSTTGPMGVVLTTTRTTDSTGSAQFGYVGPGFGATDTIDACGDKNNDGDCIDTDDVNFGSVTDVTKYWAPEAATSSGTNYVGSVQYCDLTNDTVYVLATTGPQTGNRRFVYDSGDQYNLDGTPDGLLNGTATTMATWETKCGVGDQLVINYNISGVSQFENDSKAP